MIITISGTPGSGKSTLAKLLAKKYKLKQYSVGEMQRQLAQEKNMTELEYTRWVCKHPKEYIDLDNKQKRLAKKDNILVDSRLGFHFIPNSIKIFIKTSIKIGAKRIMSNKRKEETYTSEEQAIRDIQRRVILEKKTYKQLYGINHYDLKKYDLVLDSTTKSVQQLLKEIAVFVTGKI
jgi:CMP/dCMP kinase